MSKRKANTEFVWERNIRYDIQLLREIIQMNPFASKNESPIWDEIVENLSDHPVPMQVSVRSCRERTAELLKNYRRKKKSNKETSVGGNAREADFHTLITEVSKLEEAKLTEDRISGEASNEIVVIDAGSDSEKDILNASTDSSDDFEFGPDKKGSGKKPKSDVVKYLETKHKGKMSMRKEELRVREEELAIRKAEVEVQRIKAETEAERSKNMMTMLMKAVIPPSKK